MVAQNTFRSVCKKISQASLPALKEMYDIFNNEYFGNTLPRDCPMKWRKWKATDGQLFYEWTAITSEAINAYHSGGRRALRKLAKKNPHKHLKVNTYHIGINRDPQTNSLELMTTLIHEMVHLEQLFNGDGWPDHGNGFDCRYYQIEDRFAKDYGHAMAIEADKQME